MIMITGGAFQGKKEFVKKFFSVDENDILNGANCDIDKVFSAKCMCNYHLFIGRLMNEGIDPLDFTEKLCKKNRDIIIIMNEIGCGIILLEKNERNWREQVGRAGCIIAEKSSDVFRICCGIPTKIKGEML